MKDCSGLFSDMLRDCCGGNRVMAEEQNGFCKHRKGEDNMAVVNAVIWKIKTMGERAYFVLLTMTGYT